jgi:alpha-glucosidase (family GH31 glycosyl hydrolase)
MTRGMYLEEPGNPEAYRFDQFFFGPQLLVAPVLSAARKRTVYLPQGEWWEFETAKRLSGGLEITRPVELKDVPVYAKAGSIIPRQNPDGELHAGHIRELILDVYGGADGTATLYEDDGKSSRHREGEFCRTRFDLRQNGRRLVLSATVAEGKPLGVVREVSVTLALDSKPASVSCDGKELSCEDGGQGRWNVRLGTLPADKAWRMSIELG